jgi:hypothetical protein
MTTSNHVILTLLNASFILKSGSFMNIAIWRNERIQVWKLRRMQFFPELPF